MFLKIILTVIFILYSQYSSAQKIIFSDYFENKQIDSSWHIITGNWHIADVQELRIAPAEGGYQHVLCSGGKGYIGDNIIRLIIDLPDSSALKKIKLSFAYYILANAWGTKIEAEFHKKDLKDGLKGKIWTGNLTIKRRWTAFQKILKIPPGANAIQIVFFGLQSSGKTNRIACFDNVMISALR